MFTCFVLSVHRTLQKCANGIVEAYRPWCANITYIMDAAWQNMDYANYIGNITSFNPSMCSMNTSGMILQK